MKHISICLFLFFVSQSIFSQDQTSYKNAIGIDAINGLAAVMGNHDQYDVLEVGYIRRMKEIDFRMKFNFNANDINLNKTIQNKFIDEENELRFNSDFRSSRSLLLSVGFAKRIEKEKINYYIGIDAFSGINIGYAYSSILDENNQLNDRFLGELKSTTYKIGLAPIIGTKIPLQGRITLELEFGLPMFLNMGSINYFDEEEIQKEISIDDYYFGFDRLLNDVRISYNF